MMLTIKRLSQNISVFPETSVRTATGGACLVTDPDNESTALSLYSVSDHRYKKSSDSRSHRHGSNRLGSVRRHSRSNSEDFGCKNRMQGILNQEKIRLWNPDKSTNSKSNHGNSNQAHYYTQLNSNSVCQLRDMEPDPVNLRFSHNDYRRLTEQVKDNTIKSKARGKGFQTFYYNGHGENVPVVYRSQLAQSIKAFQDKPQRRPYVQNEAEMTYVRCRPVSCHSDARRPPVRAPIQRQRAKSAVNISQSIQHQEAGEFDSLTPALLYELSNGTESNINYGDKKRDHTQVLAVSPTGSPNRPSDEKAKRDENTMESGIESIQDSDSSEDNEVKVKDNQDRQMQSLMNLRPEKLDEWHMPEGVIDRRKFDFDADNVDIPVYEFKYPISGGFERMDWKDLVETIMYNEIDKGASIRWQEMIKRRPKTLEEEAFIDKLITLERHQIEAEEWEERREKSQQSKNKRRLEIKTSNISKYQSAKRDRNCCAGCLQPACAGDCPGKRVPSGFCIHCRQKYCNGNCQKSFYDYHSRDYTNDSFKDKKLLYKTRPKSCGPCQTTHKAKVMNANNVILGRPRSCNATYARGAASRNPQDLRPVSATSVSSVEREITKLGISPVRANTARTGRRLSGRNTICPGKSYFSQRRNSLTDPSRRIKSAGQVRTSFKDFRGRSSKNERKKRPSTAV